MAQERCSSENDECLEITTEKWNPYIRNDGTIWTMCENHSTLPTQECVDKAIQYNHEDLEINAAKRNVIQQGGHWIFPGDVYTIPTK